MKRVFDIGLSAIGLILASPVLLPVMFLVWNEDKHSPFYIAPRVGRGEQPFRMVKLRSMVINADKSGIDSTSAGDRRITPVGHFIRRYKLDEVTQLWNVLKGDMSLVGPRPNVERETRMYTNAEKALLSVRPGITDYASIVFSDEGEILRDQADPDIAYNQLIRPWKGHLGLFYVANRSLWLDLKLVLLTAVAIASRRRALAAVVGDLKKRGAPADLIRIAAREEPLAPTPPPGANAIVTERY
jgi:lipopolysaccharide/colanic/teichoic acid biosynthesis glycosyltransferase